jgi:hypothetical protein
LIYNVDVQLVFLHILYRRSSFVLGMTGAYLSRVGSKSSLLLSSHEIKHEIFYSCSLANPIRLYNSLRKIFSRILWAFGKA